MNILYLDYAATTPVDPKVAKEMTDCLTLDGCFGNPASNTHFYGWQANEKVNDARAKIAELIHADSREIIWTSGATESNNLAIKGVTNAYLARGKNIIITSEIEHKAVLDPCKYLEKKGFDVIYLKPNKEGIITLDQVKEIVKSREEKIALVSLMYVNNELGSINPISEIGKFLRSQKILFHVDAAQAGARLKIDVKSQNIDLLSLSGHKLYGPKGIGILYIRRKPKVLLEALIHGGGHERGFRSGTLATHQIVGMGKSADLIIQKRDKESQKLKELSEKLWAGIAHLPKVRINADGKNRIPSILNICFSGVDGEALMMSLNKIAVSAGSACTSATIEPSYVLQSLGLSPEDAHSSLRVSLGRFTTESDIDFAIKVIVENVTKLRQISPFWKGE